MHCNTFDMFLKNNSELNVFSLQNSPALWRRSANRGFAVVVDDYTDNCYFLVTRRETFQLSATVYQDPEIDVAAQDRAVVIVILSSIGTWKGQ